MYPRTHSVSPSSAPSLDRVGMVASLACALHCALMPLVLGALPLLELGFLGEARTEWLLVGLSAVVGVTALTQGYRQHHKKQAFATLFLGLALLLLGRLWEEQLGVGPVVLGGLTVAGAHFLNHRLNCRGVSAVS